MKAGGILVPDLGSRTVGGLKKKQVREGTLASTSSLEKDVKQHQARKKSHILFSFVLPKQIKNDLSMTSL